MSKLINKKCSIGIRGNVLNWFRSYLDNRTQVMNICGLASDFCRVNFGFNQEDTLGPILFLIYTNNISKIQLQGNSFLFADDTAIL